MPSVDLKSPIFRVIAVVGVCIIVILVAIAVVFIVKAVSNRGSKNRGRQQFTKPIKPGKPGKPGKPKPPRTTRSTTTKKQQLELSNEFCKRKSSLNGFNGNANLKKIIAFCRKTKIHYDEDENVIVQLISVDEYSSYRKYAA